MTKCNATATFNRDFIYSIPSKILFNYDLTFLEIKVYMIIRSFMDTTGDCYPSNNWIAEICKVEKRSIIRAINSLVDKSLIERITIKNQRYLVIKRTPLPDEGVTFPSPPSDTGVTPPRDTDVTQLDQNNINTNILTASNSNIDFSDCKKTELEVLQNTSEKLEFEKKQKEFKKICLENYQCQEIYKARFSEFDISLEQLYQDCCDYWSQKNQLVFVQRFLAHLRKAPLNSYQKKNTPLAQKTSITPDEDRLIQEYCSLKRAKRKPSEELNNKIINLVLRLKACHLPKAKEALAAIDKANEIFDSRIYTSLISEAKNRVKSAQADNCLKAMKDALK